MTPPSPLTPLPPLLRSYSERLRAQHLTDPSQVRQVQVDALRAHAEARQKLPSFLEALEDLSKRLGVTSQSRPGGLKKLERYMEKYLRFDLVPLDILAAKLVFTDLQSLYQAAERVPESFTVVGLRDRFAQPRASGYLDIQ